MNFLLRHLKLVVACLVMLTLTVFSGHGALAADILTTEQIVPGMQAVAKTVVDGSKIETFSLEILGVMSEGKENEGKILAKASGELIDRTDGILQGMSGSPVYVDGKLIGAVSAGWKDINKRLCMITPITDMLKIWEFPDNKGKNHLQQIDLKAWKAKPSDDSTAPPLEIDPPAPANSLVAEPVMTPLMVTGFGNAGLKMLSEHLAPFNLVPYAVGASDNNKPATPLEPGSAIGVQIVRGDISMSAIGTVTAVEDNKVLGFGHPFLRKGNVNYFMTNADIITTASGANAGFKIGTTGEAVGRINQDRSAGIAGVIGQFPSVVPLKVVVEDAQTNKSKEYAMQIAYDESLLAALIPSLVYNAIDNTIDRTGTGTAKVSFDIMTNSAQNGKLSRDNMFYNGQDVGQMAVSEIYQAINLLSGNAVKEADVVSVKVNVKIDEVRRTASITDVSADKKQAKAGDTVNLTVKIKPYRDVEKEVVIPYKIPQQQGIGQMNLEVRGGGLMPVALLLLQQQGFDLSSADDKMMPLDLKLKQFVESNRNNEIIVGPAPVIPKDPADKSENHSQQVIENEIASVVPTKQSTNYIIDNAVPFSIKIVK